MSSEIVPFAFEGLEVRTLSIEDEPWFVAGDVLAILGLDRTANRRLEDDEMGVAPIHTLGGLQNLSIVNEPGLYSLILGSRKAEAKAFKRWITHEVLPSIRTRGSYIVPSVERALPTNFAEALRLAAAEVEAHEATRAELEHAAPRAEAWDAIVSAEGDYSVGDAAKILARAGIPTGPQRLFNQLLDLKWTYRGSDAKPRAYAERVEKGYLAEKPQFHYHPGTGERVIDPPQVRVTVKGVERLRQRLHDGALQAVSA